MSITVPEGLSDLLQDFAIVVLREKPKDLVEFAANYFTDLHERSKGGKTDKQKSPERNINVVITEETVEMQDEVFEMCDILSKNRLGALLSKVESVVWDLIEMAGKNNQRTRADFKLWPNGLVRSYKDCGGNGNNGVDQNSMEGGNGVDEVQVIELRPMSMDGDCPRYYSDSDDSDPDAEPYPRSLLTRRKSVFAEPYDPTVEVPQEKVIYPKTDEQRTRLIEHTKKVFIFKGLEPAHTREVVDAMFERTVVVGEHVIDQGDEGDNFYIIESGKFDILVSKNGREPKLYGTYDGEGSFGELALMYNTPRAATIVATTDGVLWGLDQKTFKRIVCTAACCRRERFQSLLESVPMLSTLEHYERMNLADAMERKFYTDGECIIKQGDDADTFYLVEDGKVTITKEDPSKPGEQVFLTECTTGDYFGELALLTKKPRAASVHAVDNVVCAVLKVDSFERLLGPCMEVMKRNIENYEQQLMQLFGTSLDLSELRQ